MPGVPGHHLLVFRNRLRQGPLRATVQRAIPEQRDSAPGVMDGLDRELCPAQEVIRAGVDPQQGIIAAACRLVDGSQVLCGAYRYSTRAVQFGSHPFGMEEELLSILIWAQR